MIIDNTVKLGSLIKKARKKQGLTQTEFAALVGVGVRFIRELEAGKPSCHLAKTLEVLSCLGIKLSLHEEE